LTDTDISVKNKVLTLMVFATGRSIDFLSVKEPDKELPALKQLVKKTSMQDIFE